MAQPEPNKVPPAVEGVDYEREHRTGRKDGPLLFSCLLPNCWKPNQRWVSKNCFNDHLLRHSPEQRRHIYENLRPRKMGTRDHLAMGKMPRVAPNRKKKNLRPDEYIRQRWRDFKEIKLGEFCDHVAKDFLKKLLHHTQHGMPKNPGPLPRLLFALAAIGPDYLEPWETLRHPEYIDWLTNHIDSILTGPERTEFVMWAEAGITRLQEEMSLQVENSQTSEPKAKGTMLAIINSQVDALQEVRDVVIICESDVLDGQKAEHLANHKAKLEKLREEAISYMKIAAEFYWTESFKTDPAEAMHERVLFEFHNWRLSDDGVNSKKRNGQEGFQYCQDILANHGEREDPDQFPSLEGRCEDAEKAISDDDEEYRPGFQRFDFDEEVDKFLETDRMAKSALLSTTKKFFAAPPELSESEHETKILVTRTTWIDGKSKWQMRLDKWRLAVATERNLAQHGEHGDLRSSDSGDFSKGDKKKPEISPKTEEELSDDSGCHPQGQISRKTSTVKIHVSKSSKGKRPRSDSTKSTEEVEVDTKKTVTADKIFGQSSGLSAEEPFDVATTSKALHKSLESFDEIDMNIYLATLCFTKEKDIGQNQVSITLNDKELQWRSGLKALSFGKGIAFNFDPARFMCQPQHQQEHMRQVLSETLQRKLEESKTRVRWSCKEMELEIERITKAVQHAVDAIP